MVVRLFRNHLHKNVNFQLISVHLSPYERMNLYSLPYMNYLIIYIYVANSLETKDKLVSLDIESNNILLVVIVLQVNIWIILLKKLNRTIFWWYLIIYRKK